MVFKLASNLDFLCRLHCAVLCTCWTRRSVDDVMLAVSFELVPKIGRVFVWSRSQSARNVGFGIADTDQTSGTIGLSVNVQNESNLVAFLHRNHTSICPATAKLQCERYSSACVDKGSMRALSQPNHALQSISESCKEASIRRAFTLFHHFIVVCRMTGRMAERIV